MLAAAPSPLTPIRWSRMAAATTGSCAAPAGSGSRRPWLPTLLSLRGAAANGSSAGRRSTRLRWLP
eukprot:9315650-Alexandrium_andersonii.AAC.1